MNVTDLPWWPVRHVYIVSGPGLDVDALTFTLARSTPTPPAVTAVGSADEIPENSPEGVLVLVLNSPRHRDGVPQALTAARRPSCVALLGLRAPSTQQAALSAHGIPQIDRNQVSCLVAAINSGVLTAEGAERDPAAAPPMRLLPPSLTRRERDLVRFLRDTPFAPRRQIAEHFGISEQTTKVHLAHLRRKLGVVGRGRRALQRELFRYAAPDDT